MEFPEFILALEKRLQQPLPGLTAQLRMTSMARLRRLRNGGVPDDARPSSVLVLLYPYRSDIGFPVIRRPDYPGVHGGQVSLPGGKAEESDESLVYTALREAQEEIGIDPGQVHVIGQLTELYIPPSNFLVTPVVGFLPCRPDFQADPEEVVEIMELTLSELTDPATKKRSRIRLPIGLTLRVPSYNNGGPVIWGATAMMLSELEQIIREIRVS